MEDWRTRNFVPDSEDEGDGLDGSSDSQPRSIPAPADDGFLDIDAILGQDDGQSHDSNRPPYFPAEASCLQSPTSLEGARSDDASQELQTPSLISARGKKENAPFTSQGGNEARASLPLPPATVTNAKRPLSLSPANGSSARKQTLFLASRTQQGPDPSSSLLSPDLSSFSDLSPGEPSPPSPPTSQTCSSSATPTLVAQTRRQDVQAQKSHAALVQPPPNHVESTEDQIARRFRPRKAIQQHPYTVESQRFKNAAMKHGIKAFRYVEKQEGTREEDREEGDGTESSYSESEESMAAAHTLSPAEALGTMPSKEQPKRPSIASSIGFDFDAIPSSSPVRARSPESRDPGQVSQRHEFLHPFKRRKIDHAPLARDNEIVQRHEASMGQGNTASDTVLQTLVGDQAEILREPLDLLASSVSGTTSPSPSKARPASPLFKQTRVRESRVPSPSPISDGDDVVFLDTREIRQSRRSPTVSDPGLQNGSLSDSGQGLQIRQAQRKTKGVLPASWLTLDRKKQASTQTRPQELNSKLSGDVPRGTAHPVPSNRRATSRDSDSVALLSDSADSSSPARERKRPASNVSAPPRQRPSFAMPRQPKISAWLGDDESMEDNEIDLMVPTRRKESAKLKRQERSRQAQVTESRYGFQEQVRLNSDSDGRETCQQPLPRVRSRTKAAAKVGDFEQQKLSELLNAAKRSDRVDHSTRVAARTALSKAAHKPGIRIGAQSRARKSTTWANLRATGSTVRSAERPESIQQKMPQGRAERKPLGAFSGNEQATPALRRERARAKIGIDVPAARTQGSNADLTLHQKEQGERRAERHPRGLGQIVGTLEPPKIGPANLETLRARGSKKGSSRNLPAPLMRSYLEQSNPDIPDGSPVRSSSFCHDSRRPTERKRTPRETVPGRRYPETPTPSQEDVSELVTSREIYSSAPIGAKSCLTGLGPYGTEYPISFDIEPLPDGKHFDTTTLLGSGLVSKCLSPPESQVTRRSLRVSLDQLEHEWGVWNEAVSLDFDWIFDQTTMVLNSASTEEAVPSNAHGQFVHLTSVCRYLADHLSFSDAVDRKSFFRRMHHRLHVLAAFLGEELGGAANATDTSRIPNLLIVAVLMRALLLAFRCFRLAESSCTSADEEAQFSQLIDRLIRQTLQAALKDGPLDFKLFSQRSLSLARRSSHLVRRVKAEAFIITLHVIESLKGPRKSLWEHLADARVLVPTDAAPDVKCLDRKWELLLNLLPLFDVDRDGGVGHRRRNTDQRQNWDAVKHLVTPVLDVYLANGRRQGATFNGYVRSLFSRCFRLIDVWNWVNCESVISLLFDFFARTSLQHLHHEESNGSPPFLEKLGDGISPRDLASNSDDRSFHIFLKILWLGLHALRSVSPSKKLSGLAYRLIPNHGRQLTKDQDARWKDLEALRNHHDLLVVLYGVLPAKSRIRSRHIERLVDFANSHKEACRISAKSWSNLMRFQLSIEESETNIAPLTEWMSEMLKQAVSLHKHARVEAESHAASNDQHFDQFVSRSSQEAVIASNQIQLEGLLVEILVFLRQALSKSLSSRASSAAFPANLGGVLGLFDPQQPRIDRVVCAALDVILQYTERAKALHDASDSQESFQGSQVFSLIDFHEELAVLPSLVQQALFSLLSNIYGADVPVQQRLLTKVVDAWVATIYLETRASTNNWEPYLGSHGQFSWSGLRRTEQARKFTPYFYAELLKKDEAIYAAHRFTVLRAWVESLVERTAHLKFQNTLTMVLLNRSAEDRLLKNPPFSRTPGTYMFNISETELRERRKALLTCVLSNMRESLNDAAGDDPRRQKADYAELLRRLMLAMKSNYQSLGENPSATDDYVAFVQGIVEVLQHQTLDICRVDSFFTNPKSFPLPVSDPDYVVGRLRYYGLHLHDPGGPKTLSSFVQSISYRAALDGSQDQWTEQLRRALTSDLEGRRLRPDSLSMVFVRDICVAYIDAALSMACGWALALPLLMALPAILDALAFSLDGTDETGLDLVEKTTIPLLWHIKRSVSATFSGGAIQGCGSTLRTFRVYFAVISAALRPLDYIARLKTDPWPIVALVSDFLKLERYLYPLVRSQFDDSWTPAVGAPPQLGVDSQPHFEASRNPSTYSFTLSTIQTDLRNNWREDSGEVLAKNGRMWEKVPTDLGTIEECRRFVFQVDQFREIAKSMPAFGQVLIEDYSDESW